MSSSTNDLPSIPPAHSNSPTETASGASPERGTVSTKRAVIGGSSLAAVAAAVASAITFSFGGSGSATCPHSAPLNVTAESYSSSDGADGRSDALTAQKLRPPLVTRRPYDNRTPLERSVEEYNRQSKPQTESQIQDSGCLSQEFAPTAPDTTDRPLQEAAHRRSLVRLGRRTNLPTHQLDRIARAAPRQSKIPWQNRRR